MTNAVNTRFSTRERRRKREALEGGMKGGREKGVQKQKRLRHGVLVTVWLPLDLHKTFYSFIKQATGCNSMTEFRKQICW